PVHAVPAAAVQDRHPLPRTGQPARDLRRRPRLRPGLRRPPRAHARRSHHPSRRAETAGDRMKIEHSIDIAAPIDDVWEMGADPVLLSYFAGVGSDMQITAADPNRPPELNAHYRVLLRIGGVMVGGDAVIIEYQKPREIAWPSYTGVPFRCRLRL